MRGLASTLGALLLGALLVSIVGCSSSRPPSRPALPAPNFNAIPADSRDLVHSAWEAANNAPDDPEPNGRLGMMLLALDQPAAAIGPFERASDEQPDNFSWLYYLGMSQAQAGNPTAASLTFRNALKMRSSFVPLQLKLTETLLAAGKSQDAEHACEAILAAHPDATPARKILAAIYQQSGRTAEAKRQEDLIREATADAASAAGPAAGSDARPAVGSDARSAAGSDARSAAGSDARSAAGSDASAQIVPEYLKDPWTAAVTRPSKTIAPAAPKVDERAAHFDKGRDFIAKKQFKRAIDELQKTLTPEDGQTPGYLYSLSVAYSLAKDIPNAQKFGEQAKSMAEQLKQVDLAAAIDAHLKQLEIDAEEAAINPAAPKKP